MQTNQAPDTAGEQLAREAAEQIWIDVRPIFQDIIEGYRLEATKIILNAINAALAAERERYDDLQRSVMDLSHPNCKVLLNERNEAREQLATANDAMSGMTEHHANFGVRQERDKAMKQLAAAVEALQMLHDYQNGCPLPSYEKGWNEAMRQADAALAKPKDGKPC